jgi:hypothetical protein
LQLEATVLLCSFSQNQENKKMVRTKQRLFQIAAVVCAVILSSPEAHAGFAIGNSVTIGGEPVFAVRSGCDGFSADKRAHLAQDALDNAIVTDPSLAPEGVKVKLIGGSPSLMLNQHRIITADFGSASAEGLSPRQLADQWAAKVKEKLSNRPMMFAYKQTLLLNNPIQSTVVSKEQTAVRLPAAITLPIRLQETISSRKLKAGDEITAVVYENYRCGDLLVPQGTQVFGRVTEVVPQSYEVVFDQLRTPDGTQTRMYGTLSACNIAAINPHPVCTLAIPAGESTDARVPATIGIGIAKQQDLRTVAFVTTSESDVTISSEQNLALILDKVTPVASLEARTF